ncbi:tryptophan--tRNA ligase [Clostridia bacterium OttesenSCG-928-F22]|nr:tryptophan--tRNA ligase [Clostridia bacterium OttesenSCG-928-F22]
MKEQGKKIIFSGIQPSGVLTLGNYLGAIRNWALLQAEYECYFCVVDLHALTVRQNAAELRKRCLETMAWLVASGVSPEDNTMFFQSHVSAHTELSWVLNCFTYMGELSRMTQYKDKSARYEDNNNAGLFTYPVLMAADILLYQADLVPVGDDQRQHLEITRDIALRFNNLYSDTFVVPEGYTPKAGARIMSLQEPSKKMSKSDDNDNAFISLADDADAITRKLKRAVTDSDGVISYENGGPGVVNLLSIYAACTGKDVTTVEQDFAGMGYGQLKTAVADVVIALLQPIQQEYKRIMVDDKAYLQEIVAKGAEQASRAANKTLSKVYRKVGFAPRK